LVGDWTVGRVVEVRTESPSGRSIVLDVPAWPGNLAGHHLDVRLTAPDGYQAARSYSVASSGPGMRVQLGVDRLPDGEVSPYLVDELRVGDEVEVRGPLGRWFIWQSTDEGPVQLIAGGSGIVPLVAMLRAHREAASTVDMRLLYSVRTPGDRFFPDELGGAETTFVYSRVDGRLTMERLAEVTIAPADGPTVFVCGPTGFVEAVADWLVALGHPAARIKTERFGGA
jgi:ferredoxin-NADP reductase